MNPFRTIAAWRNGPRVMLLPVLLAAGATALWLGCNNAGTARADAAGPEITRALDQGDDPGKLLFAEHCAMCHEGGVEKAPHRDFLKEMSPIAILAALDSGPMQQQAASLSEAERRQVVEFLTQRDLAHYQAPPAPKMCEGSQRALKMDQPAQSVGWGHDTTRFIPASVAGLTTREAPRLKLKWAFGFPEATKARSQPAIAFGTIFVGSQDGTIYALDLATGCARWTSKVSAEVRTGIVVETGNDRAPRIFFGDFMGRAYALDASTGREIWKVRLDGHPNATITGTPAIAGDTLLVPVSSLEVVPAAEPGYECCTFRGSVAALDISTGKEKWRHYTIPRAPQRVGSNAVGAAQLAPSGAPVWGSPAYDAKRGLIYHGSGENYQSPADGNSDALFAVNAATGARRWVFQLTRNDAWNVACMVANRTNCPQQNGPDHDVGASPMLIHLEGGRDVVIVGQKSGMVYGVDPDTGKPRWSVRAGRGGVQGGIHFGMAAEGSTVFVGVNDVSQLADGSHAADPGAPGLVALDARDGRIIWQVRSEGRCEGKQFCDAGISAAVTATPGLVFAGHLDGTLGVYDSTNGKPLWEFQTARAFTTVNGVEAHGGSMGGPGVAISGGYLVSNSGYGFSNHMPGNVLLVFSIDGK